jgi:hypothetical protein
MFINFINNCKTAKYIFINTVLILNIKSGLFFMSFVFSLIVTYFSFKSRHLLSLY